MSKTEMQLAAEMLHLAEDSFSNHGCNDFDMSKAIPDLQERNKLYMAYCAWNGDVDDYYDATPGEPDYRMMDWMLMSYLAERIRQDV